MAETQAGTHTVRAVPCDECAYHALVPIGVEARVEHDDGNHRVVIESSER